MKILQVINAYYPPYVSGGAAFAAHNICKALMKRGHEVTVYTTNILSRDRLFTPKQNPIVVDGVKVYYFSNLIYKSPVYVCFSKELVEALDKSIANYNIIHLHEYKLAC